MSWANFDDSFAQHPKVISLSDAAFRLHVSGILYANQHLTDGVIPVPAARTLVPKFRQTTVDELVTVGLWHQIKGPAKSVAAYEIHDFLDWNEDRETVLARKERTKEANRERMRKWREAKALSRSR